MKYNLTLENKTISTILKCLTEDNKINKELIFDCLCYNLSSQKCEFLIEIAALKKPFELVYPGDYVKFIRDNQYPLRLEDESNADILEELGLYKNGYCYGLILRDGGYSTEYDPYYGQVRLNVFIHDNNKNLLVKEGTLKTSDLLKIDKNEIEYFKRLESE